MKALFAQKYSILLLVCICGLAACSGSGSAIGSNTTPTARAGTSGSGGNAAPATPPALHVQPGTRPCPVAVSDASHWDPIVITQSGVNAVAHIICGNLTGSNSIQAVVTVVYEGSGQVADIYVFDTITSPNPTKLFFLQGLYKGSVSISAYGTLLTAEVDQGSHANQGQSNATSQQDLFREFQWSNGAQTFVPVSFPGIFPDLTRYQAESDQQQVNKGSDTWKLDASSVATRMANQLLNWTTIASTNVTNGGGKHDSSAIITVKNAPGDAVQVTLGRLEGNINTGIWEVTGVTSNGIFISSPQNRDLLHSGFTVTGSGSASNGKIGTIRVLDHLYTNVTKGTTNVQGANANGNTTFSTSVSYSISFKTGTQEGLIILDTASGAIILKELLA